MFTKQQLAQWRELGYEFDGFYDSVAVEEKKELTIKYNSYIDDADNFIISINIISKNLIPTKATVVLYEYSKFLLSDDLETHMYPIDKNSQTINFKVAKSKIKAEEKYFLKVSCNNEEAETGTFGLKDSKKKEEAKNIEKKTCFCNRDFKVDELKNIIIELRKADSTGVPQTVRDKNNTKNFTLGQPILNKDGTEKTIILSQYEELGENIFKLEMDEIIIEKDSNYNSFNKELNKAFKDYNIKTCLQKMHFLSQAYHETQRFTLSFEANPSSAVIGGSFYRGRGLLHLTHKPNYEELFVVGSGEEPTDERLKLFVPTVAKSIKVACQASAWYWNKLAINKYAEIDDVVKVSAALNYPKALNGVQKDINSINGLSERKLYFNLIKPIFRYDEICKNKK